VDFAWLSGQMAGVLAVAVLGFLGLRWQQRIVSSPLFPPALLAQPAFRNVLAISFLNSAGMFGGIFLLPLMLQWQFALTPTQAGIDIVPFLAVGPLAAYTAGQVMRRTGRWRPPMMVGLWVAAAGCAGMMLMPRDVGIAWPIAVSAIFGLGLGGVMPPTLVASQALAARRDIGASTGTMLLFRAMGGAFGATLVGAVLALGHSAAGFAAGFGACALLEGAAGVIALRIIDAPLPNVLDAATNSS
jgi:MFS family permease